MWYYVTLNLFICLSKIQQVLLGIFAGPLKILNILAKKWWVGGGSNPGPPD